MRKVADFPQPGVTFLDITPVLADARAFAAAVAWLAQSFDGAIDKVVAIEARGFILGAPVAHVLG
ncbi:MAG TPA: adenine phosphoribosyltransferase, partial [Acidimicrobiales bacterium]|nr:adenine phosphoribosyltransferase [Acidimicrobiales bacterium]